MAKSDLTSCQFSYKGSVTPNATKFLKSEALSMDFDGVIQLDSGDAANFVSINKEFQSEMDKAIKGQLGALNKWLAEKDALIADMVKRFEDMKKGGFPDGAQEAAQRGKTIKELAVIAIQLEEFPKEYKEIVTDWAENCRKQQGSIAMKLAVKAARVARFDDKTFRVRAGQAIKAVLIVAAIAVSVAAIVLSAGATAPLFIGLAAAGASLAGISNVGQISKVIVENANMEKRILASAQKDVEVIQSAFGGVKDKGNALGKHVSELRNLVKVRDDKVTALENDMRKYKVAALSYSKDIVKLITDQSVDTGEVKAKAKACDEVNTKLTDVEDKIKALKADNAQAEIVLKALTDLGVQIDKFSSQAANTLAGNLKERFGKLDGWTDLGNSVGGLVNSAGGLHS